MTESAPRPYTLVAELTYRCPLRCAYCSNPVDSRATARARHRGLAACVPRGRGAGRGAAQPHRRRAALARRSRGARRGGARRSSSTPTSSPAASRWTRARLDGLKARARRRPALAPGRARPGSDRIAGRRSASASWRWRDWVRELGLPLTLNVVLHRENLDRVDEIIALAEPLGAERLELANTQYLGWALANRARSCRRAAARPRARGGPPRPRAPARQDGGPVRAARLPRRPPAACMDGWARRFIVVAPDGLVLPCHAAHTIPGLVVRERAGPAARRHLAALGRLRRVPRRGLDARALPQLRPPRPSTSAAAAARPSSSPATPPPPILPARSPLTTRSSTGARCAQAPAATALGLDRRVPPLRREAPAHGPRPLDPPGPDHRGARRRLRAGSACPCRPHRHRAPAPQRRVELALGFVLAGLIDVLVPAPSLVRWLGEEHAGRGILVGWPAGLVMPGGPYVFFPIVANLFRRAPPPARSSPSSPPRPWSAPFAC